MHKNVLRSICWRCDYLAAMVECFECGASVPSGHGYRREVYTGHTSRSSFGQRYTTSRSRRYAVRTICSECAKRLDARKKLRFLVGVGVVGLLAIVGAVSHDDKSPRSDASSAAPSVTRAQRQGTTLYGVTITVGQVRETRVPPSKFHRDQAPHHD
jgi:hypothetical protein